jgi:hypothetical protein
MQSTLTPKASDDPHDVIVVAPEAVRVAPSDDELSDLLQQAARVRSEPQARAAAESPSGPAVPPVDTTFRSAVNEIPNAKAGRSLASRAIRGLMALLLTVAIGVAAVGWKSYGEVAKKKIIKAATQLLLTPSLSSEQPADAAQADSPAAQADAANPTAPQAAPAAQTAAETAAPAAASPDSAQLLQSMARDLASLGQEVEQLKAGMEQLRASQQQTTRDAAKASEQNLRTAKASVPVPRPVVPRVRKPPQQPYYSYPQAAVAPASPPQVMAPPAPAPYVPRQVEPPLQTTAAPLTDPELESVPRPPMPVR